MCQMRTLKIRNSFMNKDIEVGKWYLISDDFYSRKKLQVVGTLNKLLLLEYEDCEEGLMPIIDVTENTPTLYVRNEDGNEIAILIEEISEISLVDDAFGEAC